MRAPSGAGLRTILVALVALLFAAVPASAVTVTRAQATGGAPSTAPNAGPTSGAPATGAPPAVVTPPGTSTSPFAGSGVWIWELNHSSGGSVAAIAARAAAHHVTTVFVKSSDGSSSWPQFSKGLIATLKASGLRVCAWQYVYGKSPTREAALGIHAAQLGADCLVIDAEQQYEGKYAQADEYVRKLRAGVGSSYPVGLAGFPYVDYHPAFPYSVFLGPQGAQFNLPQMYWRAIRTTVDKVFAHTMTDNLVYGRPVAPLGQLWQNPAPREISRFRELAQAFGSPGVSWWDWQEASTRGFGAIARPLVSPAAAAPVVSYPLLHRRARGDLVVLAQEHLRAAGAVVHVNGVFDGATTTAVRRLQVSTGLTASGSLDAPTWQALSRYPLARVRWRRSRRGAFAASADGRNGPASAFLTAKAREIPEKVHHGG